MLQVAKILRQKVKINVMTRPNVEGWIYEGKQINKP